MIMSFQVYHKLFQKLYMLQIMYILLLKNHLMVDEIIVHNLIQYYMQLMMIFHHKILSLDVHHE
jgi:hypothetical protein